MIGNAISPAQPGKIRGWSGKPFSERPRLRAVVAIYGLVWILTSIRPHDRQVWFLENIWIFVAAIGLSLAFRRFPFSDLSYALIGGFMLMHAFAANFTYELVPAGFWLQRVFGLARNDYDRVVHFAFGALITFPAREMFMRIGKLRGWLCSCLAVLSMMGIGAIHEIVEAYVGGAADPRAQSAYYSLQGDPLDSQHDLAAGLAGALLCAILTETLSRVRRSRAAH